MLVCAGLVCVLSKQWQEGRSAVVFCRGKEESGGAGERLGFPTGPYTRSWTLDLLNTSAETKAAGKPDVRPVSLPCVRFLDGTDIG
jgi:hypothetical protein